MYRSTPVDVAGNLQHMYVAHGFFVPDADYVTDWEGLVQYLGRYSNPPTASMIYDL